MHRRNLSLRAASTSFCIEVSEGLAVMRGECYVPHWLLVSKLGYPCRALLNIALLPFLTNHNMTHRRWSYWCIHSFFAAHLRAKCLAAPSPWIRVINALSKQPLPVLHGSRSLAPRQYRSLIFRLISPPPSSTPDSSKCTSLLYLPLHSSDLFLCHADSFFHLL